MAKKKTDIYSIYLDRILAGEKGFGPVEDEEVEKLLLLAKTMIAADLSINSRMRESLSNQLLAQANKKLSLFVLSKDDNELDEEDLDHVSAAFAGHAGEYSDICPYCGSRLRKNEGKCFFSQSLGVRPIRKLKKLFIL